MRSPRALVALASGLAAAGVLAAPAVAAPAAPAPAPVAPTAVPVPQALDTFVIGFARGSAAARAVQASRRGADALAAAGQATRQRVARAATAAGATLVTSQANADGAVTVRLSRPIGPVAARAFTAALGQQADVSFAEPAVRATATSMVATPSDSFFNLQWGLTGASGIRVQQAWQTTSGAGQVVAVLDTGATSHPDLAGNLVAGYDFISDPAASRDGDGRDASPADQGDWNAADQCGTGSQQRNSSWHGTHVAGVVAATANNAAGIAGVAPHAKVLPVRVLGLCGGLSSDIADAITWASGGSVPGVPANPTPAKVVNLSLGGYATSCPAVYQRAIDGALARGASVVVAAGNEHRDASQSAPGNCAGVITVAASAENGALASYSNYGSTVELMAPGGDSSTGRPIASTGNAGTTTPGSATYVYMQGTSQAAPHVAGTIALMRAANPALTPAATTSILTSTARAAVSGGGAGIVDASAAVSRARGPVLGSSRTMASKKTSLRVGG